MKNHMIKKMVFKLRQLATWANHPQQPVVSCLQAPQAPLCGAVKVEKVVNGTVARCLALVISVISNPRTWCIYIYIQYIYILIYIYILWVCLKMGRYPKSSKSWMTFVYWNSLKAMVCGIPHFKALPMIVNKCVGFSKFRIIYII